MKKLYDSLNGNAGFIYYESDDGELRFADATSDVALAAPIDPERVVWDDHNGWIYQDGASLPWAE